MARGVVVSDLHLFTRRSDTPFLTEIIYGKARENDFILLNGDIFDFRWSVFGASLSARRAALGWLKGLVSVSPSCHIYYVLGNHDCDLDWARSLDEISSENFSWSSSHFWIGENLFLHGDLPLGGKHPYGRGLTVSRERLPGHTVLEKLYDLAVFMRLHRVVRFVHTPRRCVARLYQILNRFDPESLPGLANVYFGHTHVPFSGYFYRGVMFHNTGSAVRHLSMNFLSVEI